MSDYKELIKNFDIMRDALRNFFIFGDMTRSEDTEKSSRSYDNELRRLKSWLRNTVKHQNVDGEKHYCIHLDPSATESNPFYTAYKSKSFTQKDVNLHFALLYVLHDRELALSDITREIDLIFTGSEYDNQTIRKKLAEYVELGLLVTNKIKKTIYYKLADNQINDFIKENPKLQQAIRFFSDIAPVPVLGSYIIDNFSPPKSNIVFRNYFIANCLDDIILIDTLKAMHNDCFITVRNRSLNTGKEDDIRLFPLKIFVSTNTGRRYIIGLIEGRNKLICLRLDFLRKVTFNEKCEEAESYREIFKSILPNCFTIAAYQKSMLEKLEMTLNINDEKEQYLLLRLKHEGRGGSIEKTAPNTYVYKKEVYDTREMLPWIKSFIGHIIDLKGDNTMAISSFYTDLKNMVKEYEN